MKKGLLVAALLSAVMLAGCSTPPGSDQVLEDPNHPHFNGEEILTKAQWNISPAKPAVGKNTKLSLQITDHHNKPIEEFETIHEKKMHLIIVSKDLSYFNHIHPEYIREGRFDITTQLPAAGEYKMFADFAPAGGGTRTESKWMTVGGESKTVPIEVDNQLTKQEAGKEVTLQFDRALQAGQDLMMTFTIRDAASKQPITNLEPYLGATGHVVTLSADAEQYLHVHPMHEKSTGPDALFHINFPAAGLYKIWGQFQHEGKTFIVPFVVQVP